MAALSAKTSTDRKDCGLTWNQVPQPGGVMVGQTISLEIETVRQAVTKVA